MRLAVEAILLTIITCYSLAVDTRNVTYMPPLPPSPIVAQCVAADDATAPAESQPCAYPVVATGQFICPI